MPDAIPSGRTPKREEIISDHPCLKPQHFMRIMVRSLLPLGEGTVLDPFMGSGSTIAAAEAIGYNSIGLEIDSDYFQLAKKTIPRLAALYPYFKGQEMELELNGNVDEEIEHQTAFILAEKPFKYGNLRRARNRKANSP
ncbi:MAG: site-specific DNA-methyltransferase [Verrucomicrobiota bacterium]|nr:site-specific DNA-methyltransferase [Verrucomicrobiota bacterium]